MARASRVIRKRSRKHSTGGDQRSGRPRIQLPNTAAWKLANLGQRFLRTSKSISSTIRRAVSGVYRAFLEIRSLARAPLGSRSRSGVRNSFFVPTTRWRAFGSAISQASSISTMTRRITGNLYFQAKRFFRELRTFSGLRPSASDTTKTRSIPGVRLSSATIPENLPETCPLHCRAITLTPLRQRLTRAGIATSS